MKYSRVYLDAIGFELPMEIVPTASLEEPLAPLYHQLNIPSGQVEAMTGVGERRFWPRDSGLVQGAVAAASKALQSAGVEMRDIGAIVYAGVCRESHEPATACAVAAALRAHSETVIYDLSNACVGVLSGILDLAAKIELGQIRAGLVVACESAREIIEFTLGKLVRQGDRSLYNASIATLTGGSGAVAVLVTDGSFAKGARHRLVGATIRSAAQHFGLCRWGIQLTEAGQFEPFMRTDAVQLLRHGVELGRATWQVFLSEMGWTREMVDRIISHQIGRAHRQQMLASLEVSDAKDFSTFSYLGNMGSVSVPLTAALAEERGFLAPGQRVGLLGIGSGLNCLMLGVEW